MKASDASSHTMGSNAFLWYQSPPVTNQGPLARVIQQTKLRAQVAQKGKGKRKYGMPTGLERRVLTSVDMAEG